MAGAAFPEKGCEDLFSSFASSASDTNERAAGLLSWRAIFIGIIVLNMISNIMAVVILSSLNDRTFYRVHTVVFILIVIIISLLILWYNYLYYFINIVDMFIIILMIIIIIIINVVAETDITVINIIGILISLIPIILQSLVSP